MTNYKYQQEFGLELTESWINGNREYVRLTIQQLKKKAQAAYIAACVATNLTPDQASTFVNFIHPNN